jgi:RNA-dependent RNA polymerase
MIVPPNFEGKNFNDRPREGFQRKRFKDRDRVSQLDEGHGTVAPYAPHLRLVLFDRSDLRKFWELCNIAQVQPQPVRRDGIEASTRHFFARRPLHEVERWMRTLEWKHAFQIEALLHNGLVNTEDVFVRLRPHIERITKKFGALAGEILRLYTVALPLRPSRETPLEVLRRVVADNVNLVSPRVPSGQFICHHITFTPTRMLLEGPYATQSNRVIRRYRPGLLDNFVRVDFRDEDRLSYRWDREVDGTYFLHQRVGNILKNGFELGGKYFEFLAYSTSALRSHAVWFMSPFHDPDEGYVTAERLRRSLGDFTDLLTMPSKYAARIAQAFTATDPSVTLVRSEWEEMNDIETVMKNGETSCHTDGVGTISKELGDKIWQTMCEGSHSHRLRRVQPSAVRIVHVQSVTFATDLRSSSSIRSGSSGTKGL